MKLKRRFGPRCVQDACVIAFLVVAIPVTYWFELWIVIPAVHGHMTPLTIAHTILGTYLLFNITANLVALLISDTSIVGEQMRPPPDYTPAKESWHCCAVCETIVPPRAWHCNICDTCILKRDHHCTFTGCCIGHHNQRYFMTMIFYLLLATTYATVYNSWFIWVLHGQDFLTWSSAFKLLFPFAMLLIDFSSNQYYLLIYLINCIGLLFTGVLLIYHGRKVVSGTVAIETDKTKYDRGLVKNLAMVFGNRWQIAWLSPFIESKLPHDGIHWDTFSDPTKEN